MPIITLPSLVATISDIDRLGFIKPSTCNVFVFQLSVANDKKDDCTKEIEEESNHAPSNSFSFRRLDDYSFLILYLSNAGNTTSTTSGNIAMWYRVSIAIDVIADNTTSIPSYLIYSRANETLCQFIYETSHTLFI
nr:MAG TPA: hypothetical protein [Caudoviricetes sp.]